MLSSLLQFLEAFSSLTSSRSITPSRSLTGCASPGRRPSDRAGCLRPCLQQLIPDTRHTNPSGLQTLHTDLASAPSWHGIDKILSSQEGEKSNSPSSLLILPLQKAPAAMLKRGSLRMQLLSPNILVLPFSVKDPRSFSTSGSRHHWLQLLQRDFSSALFHFQLLFLSHPGEV